MIDVQNTVDKGTRLIVQANQSMSWKANMWLAAGLGFVCMGIAIALAFFGFWMVIPFAGAEVLFVAYCLHWTIHRLSRKEVITVQEDAIRLEWGYKRAERCVDLPRQWSQLRYNCPDSPFEVGHLSLGAHGRHYTLGNALGRDEKKELYTELNSALQRT